MLSIDLSSSRILSAIGPFHAKEFDKNDLTIVSPESKFDEIESSPSNFIISFKSRFAANGISFQFLAISDAISQDIIPFDFDNIDIDKAEEYLAILFNRIGVDRRKCIITNSGHGLHVIVAVTQGFTTVDELNKARKYYVELCNDLTQEFYNNASKQKACK